MFLALIAAWALQQDAPPKDFDVSVSAPTTPIRAGTLLDIGVSFRNPGSAAMVLTPPAAFDARLIGDRTSVSTPLKRRDEKPDEKIELAPGASVWIDYVFVLPENVAKGRWILELEREGRPRAVIDVTGTATDLKRPAALGDTSLGEARFPLAEAANLRFSVHEPMYFVAGKEVPVARFQIGLKYQIFDPGAELATEHPWIAGFHVAFTQTSLWDLGAKSLPFTDSSYKPEILWSQERVKALELPFVAQTGLQLGIQHESNGRNGLESRSVNTLYVRPIFFWGRPDAFHVRFAPKLNVLVAEEEENRDLDLYRGYVDWTLSAGKTDGLELAVLARMGSHFDRGSLQFDLTYPLGDPKGAGLDIYLLAQFFSGYGESLLKYDDYTNSFRIGFAIVR